jgi:hypothetical protein
MTHPSLIHENNWAWTLSSIASVVDIEETAREHKAFQRPRGVRTASDQLRLALAYGVGLSLRQGSAWAGTAEVAEVSNPALLRRLSNSAEWLETIAKRLVEDARAQPGGDWAGWRLRLVDATSLSHPGADGTTWRLHVSYDLSGRVDGLELTDDKGAEHLSRFRWRAGDIAIADRGYAKAADLRAVVDAGAHLLVRTGWNALRLLDASGQPFDLFDTLDVMDETPVSVPVQVEIRERGRPLLPLRLVIDRLPEDQAEKARKKVRDKAAKSGKTLDPRSLRAAGFVMLLTNLPEQRAPRAILDLYRLRWQIELLFKRFKSLLDLGELPAKSRKLARTWIFAKLIVALLAEKAARTAADSFP